MVSTLECRGLVKRHGDAFQLGPLDLVLQPGITCLVGANGAGKSTLFRLLAGVDSPTAGQVGAAPVLGYLPQAAQLPRGATCRQFLLHVAWLHELPKAQRPGAVREALDVVALGAAADKRVKDLSGGMARRLGIAHAIVHRPELLLLDEPTVGLDPRQRLGVREAVKGLGDSRVVLVSTHLVEDVRGLADRVLVLDDGTITFDGTVSQLEGLSTDAAAGDTPLERALAHVMGGAE